MPSPSRYDGSTTQRKASLTELQLTPDQLAAGLGQNYPIIILGEQHNSQIASHLQAQMFKATKPEMLFIEAQPSKQDYVDDLIAKRNSSGVETAWGIIDETFRTAAKNGIPTRCVDVEHSKTPSSIKLFAHSNMHEFQEKLLIECLRTAKDNGADFKDFAVLPDEKPSELVSRLVTHCGDKLPDAYKHALKEMASDAERSQAIANGSTTAKIANFFDGIDDNQQIKSAMKERLKVSDAAMVSNIDGHMEKLLEKAPNSNAVFRVGMSHNKGVEEGLESQGYKVANVKIIVVDDIKLDKKVFQNRRPGRGDDADFIITVYDPANCIGNFTNKYIIIDDKDEPRNRPRMGRPGAYNDLPPEMQRAIEQAQEALQNLPAAKLPTEMAAQNSGQQAGHYI